MPFDRDRLTKVVFIAAFTASALTVAWATLQDNQQPIRSEFTPDFKDMFAPAKAISEEPAPRP